MTTAPVFRRRNTELVYQCPILAVESHQVWTPEEDAHKEMFTLRLASWVNVVPVTPQGDLLLIEQYRVGSDQLELEVPGGAVDPGEKDETMAAVRELEEETGFTSTRLLGLPSLLPNPAIQNNRVRFFLAKDCVPLTSPSGFCDPFEQIRVVPTPPAEAVRLARSGRMRHCLSALAILLVEPYLLP